MVVTCLVGCGEEIRKSEPQEFPASTVPLGEATPAKLTDDLLEHAPVVAAAKLRLRVARARLRLSGVLPDPMVAVEYMRVPAMEMDGMTVEIEQPLPGWGERVGGQEDNA